MFRAFLLCLSVLALASRVMALNVVLGGMTGNLTAQQMLEVPLVTDCSSSCNTVNSTINACGSNDSCVCTQDVATGLAQCEQCMFQFLVENNMRASDPRIGSNPLLAAYVAGCTASLKVNLTSALTIADGWEGPTDIILNTPATVVVVGFGAIMAGSALMMLSNI